MVLDLMQWKDREYNVSEEPLFDKRYSTMSSLINRESWSQGYI